MRAGGVYRPARCLSLRHTLAFKTYHRLAPWPQFSGQAVQAAAVNSCKCIRIHMALHSLRSNSELCGSLREARACELSIKETPHMRIHCLMRVRVTKFPHQPIGRSIVAADPTREPAVLQRHGKHRIQALARPCDHVWRLVMEHDAA